MIWLNFTNLVRYNIYRYYYSKKELNNLITSLSINNNIENNHKKNIKFTNENISRITDKIKKIKEQFSERRSL